MFWKEIPVPSQSFCLLLKCKTSNNQTISLCLNIIVQRGPFKQLCWSVTSHGPSHTHTHTHQQCFSLKLWQRNKKAVAMINRWERQCQTPAWGRDTCTVPLSLSLSRRWKPHTHTHTHTLIRMTTQTPRTCEKTQTVSISVWLFSSSQAVSFGHQLKFVVIRLVFI